MLLVQCAWAATRTKNTYFRKKYESLSIRRGKKRALIAIGHKILIAAYFILKNKEEYKDLGESYLDERRKARQIEHHMRKLKELGMDVTEAKRVA